MSNIMDEVSDDIRQQQLKDFWRENGSWIIAAAILAVVMTGAMAFGRGYQASQNMKETGALIQVINTADPEALQKYADDAKTAHAAMAEFAAAASYVQRGEHDKAAAIYQKISKTRLLDSNWRDLAALLAVAQQLDTGKPEDLHARLDDLTGKNDTWRFSALEMQALLYARENKMNEAAESLQKIVASANAPDDVRTRAATLHQLYLAAAEKKTEK